MIDILVEVKDIGDVDKYNGDIEGLGYEAMGEYGIKGRRFFLKGRYDRTHNIHIFQTENPEIKRHILFRDYIVSHPEDGKRYSQLKQELAERFTYDIEGYTNGKDSFIKEIDEKAELWFQNSLLER